MLASLGYQRLLMLFGVTVAHDLLLESLIAESSPCLRARWAFLYPGAWALVGSLAYFKGHGLPHSRVLVEGAVEVSVTGAVGLFSSVISLVSLLFIDYPTWIVVTGAVPAALAAFPGRTRRQIQLGIASGGSLVVYLLCRRSPTRVQTLDGPALGILASVVGASGQIYARRNAESGARRGLIANAQTLAAGAAVGLPFCVVGASLPCSAAGVYRLAFLVFVSGGVSISVRERCAVACTPGELSALDSARRSMVFMLCPQPRAALVRVAAGVAAIVGAGLVATLDVWKERYEPIPVPV